MTEEDKGKKKDNDSTEKSEGGEGKGDKNAMKAFYRAMYAGADPDPDDYGITVEQEQGPGARGGASSAELEHLQMQLEEMEKNKVEAENLYKRMAADFENYRKRMAKEKEEFAAGGIQRAVEAMLPALDDMDLAVTNLTEEMEPKAIIDSVNMVYKRFSRCLEQIGITQLDVIGEQFDPRMHEPVQQVVDNSVPDGSIVFQLRPGYQFNDKILRPSLVNVATGGSEPEQIEEVVEEVVEEIVEEVIEEVVEEVIEEEIVEDGEASQDSDSENNDPDDPMNFQNETQDIPAHVVQSVVKESVKESESEEEPQDKK